MSTALTSFFDSLLVFFRDYFARFIRNGIATTSYPLFLVIFCLIVFYFVIKALKYMLSLNV